MNQEDVQNISNVTVLSQENGTEHYLGDNSAISYVDPSMQQVFLNSNHDGDASCQGSYFSSVAQRPETLPTQEITNHLTCYPSSNCFDGSGFTTNMFTPSDVSYVSPMGPFYPAAISSHPSYTYTPMPTLMCSPNGMLHNGAFYPTITPCMSSGQIYQSPTSAGNMHFTPMNAEGVMLPFDKMDLTVANDSLNNCDTAKKENSDTNEFGENDGKSNNVLHPQSDNILHKTNVNGTAVSSDENIDAPTNEYFVMVHVNGGETFSVKVGGQLQNIQGPATVRMVSKKGPPMLMPMQVPPGHLVQQIVDENGVLTHVILSPYPPTSVHPGPAAPIMFPMNVPYPPNIEGEHVFAANVAHDGRYPSGQIVDMSGQGGDCPENLLNGVHSWIQESVSQHQHRTWNSKQSTENLAGRGRVQRKKSKNTHAPTSKNHLHVTRRSDFHNTSSSGDEANGVNNNLSTATLNEEGEDIRTSKGQNVASGKINGTNTTSIIRKIVNSTPPPQVSEIEAKSVLVQLYPPDCPEDGSFIIEPSDFTYELFLSENGPDAYYKCVFRGEATEILIKDLKPNLEYCVKAATRYGSIAGNRSSPVRFKTEPSEPNPPKLPILVQRSRCELALKWTNAVDNGSKIQSFLLEHREANDASSEWTEVYNGPQHYCKVNKLKPATEYAFRLCATNSYGHSPWSEEIIYSTCGLAPSQPALPKLVRQEIHGLGLSWNKRPIDDKFTLEMEDEATCHGFIPVFMGDQLSHFFDNLRRNTRYRFRLAAENVEGRSQWSDIVTYTTLPDAPSPPRTLEGKGKIQPTKFQVCWTESEDDGGSTVDSYRLQACYCAPSSPLAQKEPSSVCNDDSITWSTVYEGPETSCHVKNAQAGAVVWLRAAAHSIGGWGKWSVMPLRIRLPSSAPGVVSNLRSVISKTQQGHTLQLVWNKPENDGGAEALTYEVQERLHTQSVSTAAPNSDVKDTSSWRTIYEGGANECPLQHSLPGCEYHYRVRAKNELSLVGSWCEPAFKVMSEPSQPLAPVNLVAVWCTAKRSLQVSWEAPEKCNGSPIIEYRVDMRSIQTNSQFAQVYTGKENICEVYQNLLPATAYVFRVQALNSAGYSPFSNESQPCYTGSSVPGIISTITVASKPSNEELEVALLYMNQLNTSSEELDAVRSLLIEPEGLPRPDSLWLSWAEAPSNGSEITNYLVEWNTLDGLQSNYQYLVNGTRCFHVISGLTAHCTYKIRVRAQNAEGNGPFTAYQQATTLSAPPRAPVIECIVSQVSVLKLRWSPSTTSISSSEQSLPGIHSQPSLVIGSVTNNSGIRYQLDMSRSSEGGWQNVYSGSSNSYKVQKLNEDTEYYFRIRACTQASVGNWSPAYSFITAKAPPAYPRTVRVSESTTNSACIEWSPVNINSADTILYILQILNVSGNELEYKQVYRGSDTTYRLHDLQPATEYLVRVCALRFCPAVPLQRGSGNRDTSEFPDEDIMTSQDESATDACSESDTKATMSYRDSEGGVIQHAMRDIVGPFSPALSFTTVGGSGVSGGSLQTSFVLHTSNKSAEISVPRRRRVHHHHHTPNVASASTRQQFIQEVEKEEKIQRREEKCGWLDKWRSYEFTDTEVSACLLFAFVLLLIFVAFLAQTYLV